MLDDFFLLRPAFAVPPSSLFFNMKCFEGIWVAQSVKHPTLDLSSGLDLRVVSSSPAQCGADFKKTKK